MTPAEYETWMQEIEANEMTSSDFLSELRAMKNTIYNSYSQYDPSEDVWHYCEY